MNWVGTLLLFLSIGAIYQNCWGSYGESEIVAVCADPSSILVIDMFSREDVDWGNPAQSLSVGGIDVNGDQIVDIGHGDLITKLLENTGQKYSTYGLPQFSGHTIQGALANTRYLIQSGEMEKPKAILMAISFSVSLSWVSNLAFGGLVDLTNDNIYDFLPEVRSTLLQKLNRRNRLYWILREIKLLRQAGVEVIFPAGNDYSGKINIGALIGVTTIGALEVSGQYRAPYSNQSSLTTVYRVGDVISRRVEGGIDVTRDGFADFKNSELSDAPSLAERVNGSASNLSSIEEVRANLKKEAFLSNRQFNIMAGTTNPTILDSLETLYGTVIHYPSNMPFRQTSDGTLLFDPEGSGDSSQVAFNGGSSFALGNLCR